MRIIAGRWRGRPLKTPADRRIRPTTDRLRERLFNILMHKDGVRLAGGAVADLFAGTGALGLEALSRGAGWLTLVERDPAACALIQHNLRALGATADLVRGDATALPPAPRAHDLLLMDPPYGQGLAMPALKSAAAQGWLAAGAVAVLEQAASDPLDLPNGFSVLDSRVQRGSAIHLIAAE